MSDPREAFPDARALLDRYGLRAKKWFGQNFLVSERAFRAIVDATVSNDDNKACSGDAAVDISNVIAAASWNTNLLAIHYAKVDGAYTEHCDSRPQDNNIFILATFSDGTTAALGAIYGKSVSTLVAKEITITTDFATLNAKGAAAVAPLVREYGMLQPLKGIGFCALVSHAAATIGTSETISLAVCQNGGFSGLTECGNSFIGLNVAGATANVAARAFCYFPSEQNNKFSALIEGDTTANSSRFGHFLDFGENASNYSGEASYI